MIENISIYLGRLLSRCVADGECFVFTGPITRPKNGYTRILVKGKMIYGHRIVYEAYFSEPSPKLCVMHKCDNTRCLNPAHLTVGTHKENTHDMIKKGRDALIDPKRKLSEQDVSSIKKQLLNGVSTRKIAAIYGVAHGTIDFIKSGKNWGWVTTHND